MKIRSRTIWLILLVLAYSAWSVIPASAHALLVRSDPEANAGVVKAIQQTSTASVAFSALLAKFVFLASLALLAGQRLFIALVWEQALLAHARLQIQPVRHGPLEFG